MPKQFYTEKDIEDMFKGGIMSLEVNDNVVLTELAYEKANAVGFKLIQASPDNPPCAPVRPYIAKMQGRHPAAQAPSPAAALPVASEARPPEGQVGVSLLQERIRNAVIARVGNTVDSNLLDVIIKRVLNDTGVK